MTENDVRLLINTINISNSPISNKVQKTPLKDIYEVENRINLKVEKLISSNNELIENEIKQKLKDLPSITTLNNLLNKNLDIYYNKNETDKKLNDLKDLLKKTIDNKIKLNDSMNYNVDKPKPTNNRFIQKYIDKQEEQMDIINELKLQINNIKKIDKVEKPIKINTINNSSIIGRWIWKNGILDVNNTIPWHIENLNTKPDNFKYNKDKTIITIKYPGLYELIIGFFSEISNPNIILLINNSEVIKGKINRDSYLFLQINL